MAEKVNIGANIKAILDILDWSQTDLAQKLGVSQSTVSKWLDDEVDDEKLQKIATALAMPVEFIKKFKQSKFVNNQTNTFTSSGQQAKSIGLVQEYVDGNLDEFIILEKEKQILLIEGHIGQLRILRKMANSSPEDVQEIDAQIDENRRKIEALQNDIIRYRDSK